MHANAFSLFLQGCIMIKNYKKHLLREHKEITKNSKHCLSGYFWCFFSTHAHIVFSNGTDYPRN